MGKVNVKAQVSGIGVKGLSFKVYGQGLWLLAFGF
jgi:hypothetical protein